MIAGRDVPPRADRCGWGILATMTTDWTAFDRLLASRRRSIVESFADFLRLNSVSQEPDKVRATGEWLAAAMRARGLDGRVLETGGNPGGIRRAPGAGGHAHRADLLPLRHQAHSPQGVASAESDRARVPARARRERSARGPARQCRRRRAGRPPPPCPRRLRRQGADLVSSERDRADGRGGARAGRQREAHLRRRGGDRQPVLRPVHRGAPRPARRRRRHRDGRAQARERAPHHCRRGARRDEDRAGHRGRPARPALGQLRRPEPGVEAQWPAVLHGHSRRHAAHRGLRGGRGGADARRSAG